ncbi:MAG TPA: BBE domain-containing protein, partial [Caulobacteraceae bacterium]|nr:BBE domain-containing protein [Caulobacteraceae bacterium]
RELGPAVDTFAMQPPAGIAGLHMDPPDPVPYAGAGMLLGDLPDAGIDAFVAAVGPDSGSRLSSAEIRHDGGAMGRTAPEHGAMDCLPGSFLMFGVGITLVPEAMAPTKQWLEAMTDAMSPWDAGRYLNFSDKSEDIAVAFPPETVERLRAAKQKYDPENLFHANHPVVSG